MSKSDNDDFADIPVAAETETGANELIVFFINSAVVSAVPICKQHSYNLFFFFRYYICRSFNRIHFNFSDGKYFKKKKIS